MATETLEQIRERINAEQYSFWYSEKHAQHYALINETNPVDYDGRPDPIRKNFAVIDGKSIPYTCCTTQPNATEPFKNALKLWPDYRKVAEGKIRNIRCSHEMY